MKAVRAGSGLGDSIYLASIARHLVEKGEGVEVCSDWPDVFRYLDVKVSPFRRGEVDIIAHYTQGKQRNNTDQFQDMCIRAGLSRDIELRLDWRPVGTRPDKLQPFVLVHLPRRPMDRSDGFGDELLPRQGAYQAAIDAVREEFTTVMVGRGDAVYPVSVDIDLSNNTTISDVIDLAYASSGMLGYVSFFVPLAESLAKPALFVWARRGLESQRDYIRTITPKKILRGSRHVMDDGETALAARQFCIEIERTRKDQGQDCCDSRKRAGRPR